jgi:hypothetical protein
MIWETHRKLSLEAIDRIGVRLSPTECDSLMRGVVAPDEWKMSNQNDRTSHHYGRASEINDYLHLARTYYLNDDPINTYFNLGIALHFIQDSYVSYPSFLSKEKHDNWEQGIDRCYISPDFAESIKKINYKSEAERCAWVAEELLREVQGPIDTMRLATLFSHQKTNDTIANPVVDLNLAYRASYTISKSILGPKNSVTLDNQLNDIYKIHEKMLWQEEDRVSEQLIKSFEQRNVIRGALVNGKGLIVKIKNWMTGRKVRSLETQLASNYDDYFDKGHLKRVDWNYKNEVTKLTNSYTGWYIYTIHNLNINSVTSGLIQAEKVNQIVGLDERVLPNFINSGSVPSYSVGSKSLIRRADLDKMGIEGIGEKLSN